MKNMFKTMAVLALASSVSFAGADKDMKKVVEDQGIYVETAKPGVVLSGYVDAGYTYNFNGSTPRSLARTSADNSPKGDFNINAFKLAIEKPLGDKNEFAAGFRADLMYGEDVNSVVTGANSLGAAANNVSTVGGNGQASDFGLEQAFVQFRAPVGNGIDFKIGKFVTFMGYEVTERPANLNISYGNLFQNMIPLAHTGAAAAYKFNDIVDVKGAVVNGWHDDNAGFTIPATNAGDGYGLLGAVNVNAPGGNANIQNSVYLGFGGDGIGTTLSPVGSGTTFVYDVWGNWKPKFANDKLLLGFNYDYGQAELVRGGLGNEQWYGVALYAKYQFTEIFSLAGRGEYIHNNDGSKWATVAAPAVGGVAGTIANRSNDIYSYTLTAGFDVWENMLLRTEYRADWGNDWGTNQNRNGVTGSTWGVSHLASVQVVYSF